MAKHTPESDNSFVVSLVRHGAAAAALVLVVAAAFWGIGQVKDDEPGLIVAEPTSQASTSSAPETTAPTSPAPTDTAPATTEPTTEPTATATPTETAPEPTPTPTETETQEPASQEVDPASVSVQVLDAVLDDGGAKAKKVADDLRAAGYNVVVVNKAAKAYETTTVFWSPNGEDGAKQIGSQFGFSRVEKKPDNLSSSVDVHLVVGQDA